MRFGVLSGMTFRITRGLTWSREYHHVAGLIAPALEGWMEGGVHLHDTRCFLGGGHFALEEKWILALCAVLGWLAALISPWLEGESIELNEAVGVYIMMDRSYS